VVCERIRAVHSNFQANPVVSGKLSLKFCHKFAEIQSLNLHA